MWKNSDTNDSIVNNTQLINNNNNNNSIEEEYAEQCESINVDQAWRDDF